MRAVKGLIGIAVWVVGCGPSVPDVTVVDGGEGTECPTEGLRRCEGASLLACRSGSWALIEECPSVCTDQLGCVACFPLTGTCDGNVSHMCREDGSGYIDVECDPVQGAGCNFESGVCDGPCAPQLLGRSYVGCEYYPTVTATEVDNNFNFAVAVSNTTGENADVTIDLGQLPTPITFTVPPASVQVQTLPWVPDLKMCSSFGQLECGMTTTPAALVAQGAYRLRSTRPVTVYQFNPLEYQIGGGTQFAYVNDASLLMPANALTPNYVAATWPWWDTNIFGSPLWPQGSPGLLAITATKDNTLVRLTTTATTQAGGGAPAFPAGVANMVTMNRGDVLEVMAYGGDLTGSTIVADQPVQVIAGHYCTQIPFGVTACDHLEESMFPYESLATKYIASAPAVPTIPSGKTYITRIVATEPNTTLVYDPPQTASTLLPSAGSFVEIQTSVDFQVTADHKVLVATYMTGQDAGGGTGDPAFALAVPTAQYRLDYLFHAPLNYEVNYVNVIAPGGATVTLDGAVVSGYIGTGATGYGVARVQLGQGMNGNHTITGDMPFGISVYGYGQYTSYWYPGGLDLLAIPVE
jgi:hypothetical protein